MSFFMYSCKDFEAYLHAKQPQIQSFHPYLAQAFWEMVVNGGKRFRPNLILSIVCAQAKSQVINAYDVCLAVECLHTYSLIHDDLPTMDNASLRRNHPTLHCKYDETGAILIGDALNTYSFYLLANAKFSPDTRVNLIQILSENGGIQGMVLGQALDCKFENIALTQEQLDFIHIHKTAKLIAASLKMGAIIADLSLDIQDFLYDFGIKLGLYFQIRDDIIDSIQDEKQSGKTTHNDTHKNSYVNLMGLQKAQEIAKDYSQLLQNHLKKLQDYKLTQSQDYLNELLEDYFKPIA